MPGIVGFITQQPCEHAQADLIKMVECLRHEDFYVTGAWSDEALGVYVGWVARKGSFSDGMPLRDERAHVFLVFSGEEFPDPRTVQRLKERGHNVSTDRPSYLVHLYEEDPAFPAGLNGRFHGLLIDRSRGAVILLNDRYGMHRLYYYKSKDRFYFAAEAKAILAVCPETRLLDQRALGEFISCGCTLEGRSLFKNIHVLPSGSRWVFRASSLVEETTYFKPKEWEDQEPLSPESHYAELRNIFRRNLPRYFKGQERIGMSLTGGLDTRMIIAWQPRTPECFPCYTFAGPFRDCQDVILGRRIANVCSQSHEVIRVGREFLAEFPHYAERSIWLSDGCVDVSRAPDLYANEKAREIAPVRMSGVYGGELLRKVVAFKPDKVRRELFSPEFYGYFDEAVETYVSNRKAHAVSFAVFKQAAWSQYGILGLEETQVAVRCPFLDNDLVRTVFRAPSSSMNSREICMQLIADGNGALLRIPTDRGLYGNGHSWLEPFSHAWLEFLFKAEYAYDIGMPQWLARIDHVLSTFHLERLFLGRHKVFHFRVWYRDALAGYVRDTLLDSTSLTRSYVERKALVSMVCGHLDGKRNYSIEINKLLGLELVQRTLLDSQYYKAASETPLPLLIPSDKAGLSEVR